ncbi:MAG TPA: sigma-54 dependent transcriptional regulator [Candidatus Eisenbacteria bacterium]|jgi:DNA-binding NtrC family response regulator
MRILAVDDEPLALEALKAILEPGHELDCVTDGRSALERLAGQAFDLVITDLRMPPPDGLEVLAAATRLANPPPVVVLTAADTARIAVDALRRGASDFLIKPASPETIRAALARCGRRHEGESVADDHGLAGRSVAIRLVRDLLPRIAPRREAVLIVGETGTGKELLARALHRLSPRSAGIFVAHNMAATPAELVESVFFGHVRGAFSGASADHVGLFEQADGGTLYLDEVDSFPCCLQAKLLRVLETECVRRVGAALDRPVEVRVVASCATDPAELVARAVLRADLYYRLRQFELILPPLRERLEDVPLLAERFRAEFEAEAGRAPALSPEALETLGQYSWPGNVRELRNAIRSAAVMAGADTIEPRHLPRCVLEGARQRRPSSAASLRDMQRRHIQEVLDSVGGNQSQAARLLGIDRGTLARMLKER